jgi:hypothetical protein
MKAYGGVDVQIHIFLTSTIVGGGWSPLCPDHFNPRGRAPGTYWIGGWLGPRAGLDDVDSNSDRSVVQTVASRYSDCTIPAPLLQR